MDMLRGLAVILVALFHIQYPLAERIPGVPSELLRFGEAMQPFRMPLLFFLSGLLLPRSLAKPAGTYIRGKLRGLVWPFVLWTVIWGFCEALWRTEDRWFLFTDIPAMLMGWQHLWFLSVLVIFYAVGLVTRVVPAWVLPLPMAVTASLITTATAGDDYAQQLFWYGAFFFTGAAVVPILDHWHRLSPVVPTLMVVFSVAWAVGAAGSRELRGSLDIVTFFPSLVGVLAIVWLAPRLPRFRFLEWVGRGSIVVYLTNLVTITLAFEAIDAFGISHPWAIMSLLVGAGLVIPLALVPLANTWLFTWPRRGARSRPHTLTRQQ